MANPEAPRDILRRFASGASVSLAAAVAGQSLPLVAAAVLARILSPSAFGAFIFLYGTAATFASLTGYSFGLTATRYVALLSSRNPIRAGAIIVQLTNASARVSASAALIALVLCTQVEVPKLAALGGTWAAVWTAVLFFALAMAGVQSGILSGFHKFSDVAYGSLLRILVGLPLAIGSAMRFSGTGALAGLAVASAAACALNHWHIVRICRANKVPLRWKASGAIGREIWTQFSVPSFLAYALVTPVLWLGQTFLLGLPNGLHEVAVFNIAIQWRNVIVFIPAAMVQAATPLMAELLGSKDDRGSTRVFHLNLATSGLVALSCASLVVLLAKLILSAYGQAYAGSWLVIAVTAPAAVLAAVNNSLGAFIVASGRMWAGFLLNLFWAIAVLAVAVPMSQRWGAVGLSGAVLSAYVLHTGLQSAYIRKMRILPRAHATLLTDAV